MRILAALCACMTVSQIAVAAPRLALVNIAEEQSKAEVVIGSLRGGLAQEGYELVDDPMDRSALEETMGAQEIGDGLSAIESAIRQAKEAYSSFDYGRALSLLRRGDGAIARLSASSAVTAALADRFLLEGLIHAGRGNRAKALGAFRTVHHLDGRRTQLDPGDYRPQIVELYLRAGKDEGPPGSLSIEAKPAGARVWLDGKLVGAAPLKLKTIARGSHHLIIESEGYGSIGRIENLGAKGTSLRIALEQLPRPKQIRTARAKLVQARDDQVRLRSESKALSSFIAADLLVLIRTGPNELLEAAIYRAGPESLSEWMPAASRELFDTLSLGPPTKGTSRTPPLAVASTPQSSGPWYGTWWGKTALVGTGAVIVTVAVLALTGGSEEPGFAISGWCLEGQCAR